ncbi:MAG: IS3 family transposase [Gammaproteobacteria bacterium]
MRARADAELVRKIKLVHQQHRSHSGALKTWRVLRRQGEKCGRHRVARLRRIHGIVSKRRKRFVVTTHSQQDQWAAPNLLKRNFTTSNPNKVCVGDVTFIPTQQGWFYLDVLLDLYSRQVVGWAMGERNNTKLVLDSLEMAIARRRPEPGLIHHSGQGVNYAANAYQLALAQHDSTPSMSRRGDCWDNAVAESFFATLEFELIEQQTFASRNAARLAIFDFIEVFYNRQRAHQTLGYLTPERYERTQITA